MEAMTRRSILAAAGRAEPPGSSAIFLAPHSVQAPPIRLLDYGDAGAMMGPAMMGDTTPVDMSAYGDAAGYGRQRMVTPTGVIVEEVADDPAVTQAIRAHARKVTGFVQEGMAAMERQMMGPGGMSRPPYGFLTPGRKSTRSARTDAPNSARTASTTSGTAAATGGVSPTP